MDSIDKKKTLRIIMISAAFLLALAAIAALISLLFFDKDTPVPDEFELLAEAVEDHSPTVYDCDVSYTLSGVTLKGRYVMCVSEESGKQKIKLTYEYDKLAEIGSSDEFITTVTGTFYADDEDDIKEMTESSEMPIAIGLPKLTKDMFESYDISEGEENILLSGKLAKNLPDGVSDALLKLECSAEEKKPLKLTIAYTDPHGAKVLAVYSFSYDAQQID